MGFFLLRGCGLFLCRGSYFLEVAYCFVERLCKFFLWRGFVIFLWRGCINFCVERLRENCHSLTNSGGMIYFCEDCVIFFFGEVACFFCTEAA